MSSSSSPAAPSVVERVHSFVSEHRRAVLITAAVAVAAIGGAAYYASTSTRGDGDKGARRKDKKKGGKKRKHGKDEEGPILEEIEPKVDDVPDSACRVAFVIVIVPHRADRVLGQTTLR